MSVNIPWIALITLLSLFLIVLGDGRVTINLI